MKVAVILAGGKSKRFGGNKYLALINQKPIIQYVVDAIVQAKVDKVIIVAGYYYDEFDKLFKGNQSIQLVYNNHWSKGQSTSIIKSIEILKENTELILFLMADQPLITTAYINKLIEAFEICSTQYTALMPKYKNVPGNPVMFNFKIWQERLKTLEGDSGARKLLQKYSNEVYLYQVNSRAYFLDADTQEEFELLKKYINLEAKSENE